MGAGVSIHVTNHAEERLARRFGLLLDGPVIRELEMAVLNGTVVKTTGLTKVYDVTVLGHPMILVFSPAPRGGGTVVTVLKHGEFYARSATPRNGRQKSLARRKCKLEEAEERGF